ncbi:uncharacterized protein N7479_001623 [Penicillium vulpinum]|uniref:uncharacterized protein n=1 Tax=Penicillium vulpinum TaxID=29845 RepID=UPI0025485AFC|nr:uncharacterized protein N7479_001623 [Penicillium vulpinum]KAJ5971705.1 hypothetical protein N7479_001623 [Penicillium vulpinum]
MATTISQGEKSSGFQAGMINGNIGNVTIVQSETLNQECLRDLHATNPVDDKKRIKNDKGGLLKDSYRWILDNKEFKQWQDSERNRLLWIKGDPGKGKTMLLCGVIEELTGLYGDNASISFFFCQATDMRINSATSVLRGLIYLLVKKNPSLLHHVRTRYDYAGKTVFEDVNAWSALSTIFRDILNDPKLQMTYLVIDALDECTSGLRTLLDLIVQESSVNPQIKWVVSSRNWPEITERLEIATQLAPISLELNEASVSEAVNQFIQHKVDELAKAKSYSEKTRDGVQSYLSSNSQGTFLWVALVCQNLEKIRFNVLKKLKLFPPGLEALYGRMISQVCESEDAELCKKILAIMSTVFRPITLHELTSFIKLPDEVYDNLVSLEEIIAICGSFFTLREHTIVFVHQSAKEFLLKEALSEILPKGIEAEHDMIFVRSLDVIFKTLQRDIWNIKSPGIHTKDICKPSPNPLAAVEYSCVYWMDHLEARLLNEACELGVCDRGRVDTFLQQKLLHWLEALSILGSVSDGIQVMQKLEMLIEDQRPEWVLNDPVKTEEWSPCFQTFEGHSDGVTSVAWSPDGSRLASASHDKTVRIWDPATGQSISTLDEHSGTVMSISWSPDGSRLASASGDKTVRIWDPATGQSISTLDEHSGTVMSISWSPDGSRLASASDDKTVRIWDRATSQSISTLEGYIGSVTSIAWSPDGSQLASASNDKTVRIWDPVTSENISTLDGHGSEIISIAWSPDGSRLASASNDNTARTWDPATRQALLILEGHSAWVNSIAWSPDGSRLASVSEDKTARVWDPATGQSISTLGRNSGSLWSIAWSPDGCRLALASGDGMVRIWDPATGQSISTLDEHSEEIISIAWSPDGSQIASASYDNTVRIWNPATSQSISTLDRHIGSVISIAWSPDGNRLASASVDKTVRIWDLATGQNIITLDEHSGTVTSIAWSPDGSRLALASVYRTVRIWDPATGQSISTLNRHSNSVISIAWSPDGSQLASASCDKTVRTWDPVTGQSISTFEGHSDWVWSIAWSPDGSRLASASRDKTVRIWDPASGQSKSNLLLAFIDSLQFENDDINLLRTNNGTYDIGSKGPMTPVSDDSILPLKQYGYGLSQESSWITYNGLNLLWLPPDYRPSRSFHFAKQTNALAICSSSRLIFLTFSQQNPISSL